MVSPRDLVWRIGNPTRGLDQYSTAWFTAPGAAPPVFRVGTSREIDDWPIVHPGPLNAGTGWVPCSATILFDDPRDAASSDRFDLVLDVLAMKGPCPDLELCLNGRRGLVVLAPWRDDRTRMPMTSPIAAWSAVTIPIDPAWLRSGENELVITTVNAFDPAPDEQRRPQPFFAAWFHFGSAISYGSIELRRTTASGMPAPAVRINPLPLYTSRGDGALDELVDVVIDAPLGYREGSVRLTVGEHVLDEWLDPQGRSFGHTRVRFGVPELDGPQRACVEVHLDGVAASFDVELRPARKWTLHLLPHVHLDIGYTDFQGKIVELHSRNVDRALAIVDDVPDYAMSIDGSLILESFNESRSPATADRMLGALRDGSMSCNAFYALFLSGIASLEECYRAAYLAKRLADQHGFRFDYANLTDVPSYSQAIPSVLASLGLRRFMGITNHGRAGNEDSDVLHLASPFQWEGPDGGRVTAFFADCYSQLRFMGADPPTIVGCADGFSRFMARYDRDDYLPQDLPIVGIHADNEDLANGEAELVARWNATYAFPKLRYSTITDYFDAVEHLSDSLPVVRGDGGSYWEDGVGSQAAAMMTYRRAQQDLPVAEAVAALTTIVDRSLRPARARLDAGWHALVLGCEHTWSSWHAQGHPDSEQTTDTTDWKLHQIRAAARAGRDEKRRALSQLGERVTTNDLTLLVVNTLSWARDGDVELEVPAGTDVVDAQGAVLRADVVRELQGLHRIRVTVDDVPAFGYRTFRIRGGGAGAHLATGDPLPRVLETPRYRLTSDDRGRVVGLEHVASGRQLIDPAAAFGLGEVVYVAGGGDDEAGGEHTSLYDWARTLPRAELDVMPAPIHTATVERRAASTVVRLRGTAPTLPVVETELEMHDGTDRVDVRVQLTKEATLSKESVYVAFPFAVDGPTLRYDRQQGWVDPMVDHQPGACNEWLTIQHVVDITGANGGVTWVSADAPLFTVGDVVRGRWPRQFGPPSSTLLSWVMNNYWWTNYPASQHGEVSLRYAFEPTNGWDPARAARFGREVRTPLEASDVTVLDKFDTDPRPLPAAGTSVLRLDAPDQLVATVHGAADGRGVIVRVQETAGIGGVLHLHHPAGAGGQAWTCAATEDDLQRTAVADDGIVAVDVGPHAVATVRLVLDAPDPDPGDGDVR